MRFNEILRKLRKLSPSNIKAVFKNDGEKTKKYPLMLWLSGCFFAFSAISLIILWTFQTVLLGSFYKAIKTKNITNCAQSIELNINNSRISDYLDTIAEQNDTCVMLCTHDVYGNYKEVYSLFVNPSCRIKELETKDLNMYYTSAKNNKGNIISIYESSDTEFFRFDEIDNLNNSHNENYDTENFIGTAPTLERNNAESLIHSSTFVDDNGKEYLLLLESVVTPSHSTVQTLRYQLYILTFAFIVISITTTIFFSKLIATPIENMNNSAKELAEGNYDVVFNGGAYKEVDQLSETLNYATSELSQVDQMRKDLIANVSHDLRTPLTLITGYGEVMRDIPGENTPENIQIIIDEATRLSSLVSDLIDISKIEAGTMKLEATTFCITDTIKDMFGRYNKLKEQDGFTFDFDYEEDVYVYADQLKISQVVYNLVNNAVNYSGESKAIRVRQSCQEDRVRIEVIDSGPGIPPDKLKNIWDRYYKVDKSHRSAKIGTGLGLSIVKTVLKLHKAQYGVFSTLGKGTTFWFELIRTNKDGEPYRY